MLKKVLLSLVAIFAAAVVIFVIVVSMQPSDFRIERSATIDAPVDAVFAQVNNLQRWETWSPWADIDPDYETTYSGEEEGTGAVFYWSGNNEAGEGRMTIMDSRPGERIEIKLEFIRPFESTNTTEFTFEADGNQTHVVWSMHGENGFAAKAFGLFFDMDAMVGADFERGLTQLETATVVADLD